MGCERLTGMKTFYRPVLGHCAALMMLTSTAYAEQSDQINEQDERVLEPLYVSARQEGEEAEKLAFSVDVIDANAIENSRRLTLEDVLMGEPSVNINTSGGANVSTIYIRGVGALYPMSMDDSSVALMLDGSPLSSRNISLGTLDVQQVEILKGPQGTLFGGLGEAGGINITSRKPTPYQEGYVRGEYGEDQQYLVEGAISGPITDQFSGRLAIRTSGYDSWVSNDQTHDEMNSPKKQAFRGSALWQPTSHTQLLISAERHKLEDMAEIFVLKPYGDNPSVSLTPGLYDQDEKDVKRYSIKLSHDFNHSQVTATTSYTDSYNIAPVAYGQHLYEALYGTAGEYWQMDESREKVLTQDLRLSSLPGADVFWVAGASLSQSDRYFDTPYNSYGAASARHRDFETNRYGLYGEASFPISEKLELTTGLRYSWEDREYEGRYHQSGAVISDHRTLNDDFLTGRLGLSYSLTESVHVYSMLARGYNPGGFNDYASQPAESAPYRSAKTNSYELGIKKRSLDGKYSINGAIFYNDLKDNHLLSYDAQTFISSVVNADTRSIGVELSAMAALSNDLRLEGGVSYTDATIETDLAGVGGGDVDKGNHVPDVSRWSGKVAVNWKHPVHIPGFTAPLLNTRLSWSYTGTRSADPQNHFDLDAYRKLDIHLGLVLSDAELYLWGSNVLDEEYDLYGYYGAASAIYGAPGRGRTLGAGIRYDW